MINQKRVVAVLPAYNAAKTLKATVRDIPDIVDEIILVDDRSSDETLIVAKNLGLTVIAHEKNCGYGGNQKTCYKAALERGADVVVMVHPDYQYNPLLIAAMASMIAYGTYDLALGSRILGGKALDGGMPFYKYLSNRFLTKFQNLCLGARLSEYHTGFRAYSRQLLLSFPFHLNSDDFVFDNQVLAQCILLNARIGEISCPTRYFPEASSINFLRSMEYGLGVMKTTLECMMAKFGIWHSPVFRFPECKLPPAEEPEEAFSLMEEQS